MIYNLPPRTANAPEAQASAEAETSIPLWSKGETMAVLALLALAILVWLPRLKGPIDLRWDGGVYYILGTSLAEGKGYKLLNEPGEIDAVQYPPLLPAIIAGYQLLLGTNDPTTVGWWLRFSAFIVFIIYVYVTYRFFRNHLPLRFAFLATLLCLFSLHVYFLSDLCFPEILFSLATVLFVLCSGRGQSRTYSVLAYLCAVASYALRTVGMAAFAAWVLDSLVRRRFKQAAWRAALVLVPIFCWQFYISSVESSYAYNHPAYPYQRAPYMFYNVSYARNVSLRDPFAPEEGATSTKVVARRFVDNAIHIPVDLAEQVSTSLAYWRLGLHQLFSDAPWPALIIKLSVLLMLYSTGIFVLGGFVLQLSQRQWLVPLYGFVYLAALCLTPFPGQFKRYLVPIIPFIVLSLIVFLSAAEGVATRLLPSQWSSLGRYLATAVLSVALFTEILCLIRVYAQEHQRVAYFDYNNQPVDYRLFFYQKKDQGFDLSVTQVRQQAKPGDIVATGTPHWLHLRTGLKAVMPPFEKDADKAQQLLDSVPVSYLIIGPDPIDSGRYTVPVVRQFPAQWRLIYCTPEGDWTVYQRVNR